MHQKARGDTRAGPERISHQSERASLPTVPMWFPAVEGCVNPGVEAVCRQTQCRYHLEHRGPWDHELRPTRDCALAVANEGSHTREEVAVVLGVSEERVRQLEESALRKLRNSAALRDLCEDFE